MVVFYRSKENILSKGIVKVEGIRCDNPSCDYENIDVQPHQYQAWVNQPCPKCGEVLLTENDFNLYKLLMATTTIANGLDSDEEVSLPTEVEKVYTPHVKSPNE